MNNEPAHSIEVAIEADLWHSIVTNAESLATDTIKQTLAACLPGMTAEVSVMLCDDAAITALNARFRAQAKPTNVLSFPAFEGPLPATGEGPLFMGDIAVAAETVALEARSEGKTPEAHLTHLLVHGTLHLLGFDHQNDAEAEAMEAREREILAGLGIGDPYAEPAAATARAGMQR